MGDRSSPSRTDEPAGRGYQRHRMLARRSSDWHHLREWTSIWGMSVDTSTRTNWHYECAHAFIEGQIGIYQGTKSRRPHVAEAKPQIACPEWTEYRNKNGLDPLGMQNTSVVLYQRLLPGISNVTLRLRYY